MSILELNISEKMLKRLLDEPTNEEILASLRQGMMDALTKSVGKPLALAMGMARHLCVSNKTQYNST